MFFHFILFYFISFNLIFFYYSNQEIRLNQFEESLRQHILSAEAAAVVVSESVTHQEELLISILQANEEFLRARKTDQLTVDRDDMVSLFNNIILKCPVCHILLTLT